MKSTVLAACLFCTFIAGQVLAEPRQFIFHPPDSLTCTGVTVTVRTSFVNDQRGPVDTIRIRNHLLYTQTDTGYRLLSTPDSITITRNGQAVNDPVTDVIAHTPITYEFDSTGQAVAVHGYERVLDEVSASVPEVPENLRQVLDDRILSAGALTEWDTRVGSMIGMELKVGEVARSIDKHYTPDGQELPLFQIMKIADTFYVGDRFCARLYRYADTDFDRLATSVGMSTDSLKQIMSIPSNKAVTSSMRETSSQTTVQVVMEVATMMILSEHVETLSEMPITGKDGKVRKLQLLENIDKEYNFGSEASADR